VESLLEIEKKDVAVNCPSKQETIYVHGFCSSLYRHSNPLQKKTLTRLCHLGAAKFRHFGVARFVTSVWQRYAIAVVIAVCFVLNQLYLISYPYGVRQDHSLPKNLSATSRASTAAIPATIHRPREPPALLVPMRSTWENNKGKMQRNRDLSMAEPTILLCNLLNLPDTSIPKELENDRCDLFLPKQAGCLYHFRMPPSQLPTHLSPQTIYLGLPYRALFKEMLPGLSPT